MKQLKKRTNNYIPKGLCFHCYISSGSQFWMLCIRKTVAPHSIARLFVCACVYIWSSKWSSNQQDFSYSVLFLVLGAEAINI